MQLKDKKYTFKKISAMRQQHVARKVLGYAASLANSENDFGKILLSMSDLDAEWITLTLLDGVHRVEKEGVFPVVSSGHIMFDDLTGFDLTLLAINSYQFSCADFLPSSLPTLTAAAAAPTI
jgi:hypothetical protein